MGLIAYAKQHSVAKQRMERAGPSATKPAGESLAPGMQAQTRVHLMPPLNADDSLLFLTRRSSSSVGFRFSRDQGLEEGCMPQPHPYPVQSHLSHPQLDKGGRHL